jgi:glycine hydroxymethyltransferase
MTAPQTPASAPVRLIDPEVAALIDAEEARQRDCIRLIASENYTSRAVMAAMGSVFTNKYSEGYPGKRYYQGQVNADAIERLAIVRAKALFGADHINVQPYSGSVANLAMYMALAQPGDPIVGLGLPHGGHLSHGWSVNVSGKFYNAHQYGVDPKTERIDLQEVRKLCLEVKPKVLVVGTTSYPRALDFDGFGEIAREVGAYLVADVAHVSGLIAGGAYPNPVYVADVITTTTHKTLRGPRGGMLMCKAPLAAAIDRAVFPGLQGGPHMNKIAGLCVALQEASQPEFRDHAQQVITNAQALGDALSSRGFRLVTGGTDSHLLVVDLTPKGVAGKPAAQALERAGLVCNYNSIPFDPRKPFDPSGIRIGTPAMTTRGLKADAMAHIARWIDEVVTRIGDPLTELRVQAEVLEFLSNYPLTL